MTDEGGWASPRSHAGSRRLASGELPAVAGGLVEGGLEASAAARATYAASTSNAARSVVYVRSMVVSRGTCKVGAKNQC